MHEGQRSHRKNGQNFSLNIRKKRTKLATDDILKSAVSFI